MINSQKVKCLHVEITSHTRRVRMRERMAGLTCEFPGVHEPEERVREKSKDKKNLCCHPNSLLVGSLVKFVCHDVM